MVLVTGMLSSPSGARAAPEGKDSAGSPGYIARRGVLRGALHLPSNAGKAVQFAAEELREHLKKITGGDLRISDGQEPAGEGGFVLAVRTESEWKGRESPQAFTIEQSVVPAPVVTIAGNSELAVVYGVYQYLGDLGVRWLAPGDIGTNIPGLSDVPIRPGKRAYTPSFSSRVLSLSSDPKNHFGGTKDVAAAVRDYQLYLIRNRTQFGFNRLGAKNWAFNVSQAGCGAHAVKPMTGLTRDKVKELMDKEPERFALVTGTDGVQRRVYDEGQVCFSNEKNIQTAISNCIEFFERLEKNKGARNADLDSDAMAPMALSDGFGICECEGCTRVAGKAPNSKDRLVWRFWNRVAGGLDAKLPGRFISVTSPYLDLTEPPDDIRIAPNIMDITPVVYSWEKAPENQDSYPFPKTFLQWITRTKAAGATLGSYQYLNFPWSPTPLHILDAAQGFAGLGYTHYHLEAMQRTEYAWPIVWSLAQFTWNAGRSPRDYLKDYCREYFGTPADQEVLRVLEEMTRNAGVMERINFGSAADTASMFPDAFIAECRERLGAAVRSARGNEKERLGRFADSIEAQFQLAETYRAHARALNSRTAQDVADFRARAHRLKEYWRDKNLDAISTTNRTPAVAADLLLKTDFAGLVPAASKSLAGKGPADGQWLRELFAGVPVPKNVPNLFPLPEVWRFHLECPGEPMPADCLKPGFAPGAGWPEVSSWNCPSSQGYANQVGGYFWYWVRFKAPEFPKGKKVLLRIGSLDDTGDVYLNGVKVGSQPEPRHWDRSFEMDVTACLKPGEDNTLVIQGYDSGGGEGVWRPSALYTE